MADIGDREFSILVVCTANICRSPMIEHLLRRRLATDLAGAGSTRFDVRSAGIRGWEGAEMDPTAAAELRRRGGDPTMFRARALQDPHTESADLILTAALEHRTAVLQAVPSALRRAFTLLEFAHLVTEVESVRDGSGTPTDLVRRAAAARGAATIADYDIADPFKRPAEAHREVAAVISRAVDAVATALSGSARRAR